MCRKKDLRLFKAVNQYDGICLVQLGYKDWITFRRVPYLQAVSKKTNFFGLVIC